MRREKIRKKNQPDTVKNIEEDEYINLQKANKSKNSKKEYDSDEILVYNKIIRILIVVIVILVIIIIALFFDRKSFSKNESENNVFTLVEQQNNTQNNQTHLNNSNINETNNQIDINIKENNNESIKINNTQIKPKRKIYVKYMDFWPAFELDKFDVHRILSEKYDVVLFDTPDYVIFGEFGVENIGMENKFNCVKLFLTIENRGPDFGNTDYAIGIHYLEKGDRYFRKPTETHQ